MKTREKSYSDYGFRQDEAKKLKEYCRSAQFNEHEKLLQSAINANKSIASELYYSIVRGISYDELIKIKHIPFSKTDFYGYQRRCLALFKKCAAGS